MKKLILIIFTLATLPAFCQDGANISITPVVKITADNNLNAQSVNILKNKIIQMFTSSGMSGDEPAFPGFICYPNVAIISQQNVSGLTNQTISEISLTLIVKGVPSGKVYNSATFNLRGLGATPDQSLVNAISKLSSTSNEAQLFTSSSRTKILNYYKTSCISILNQTKALESARNYQEAIGLLYSLPDEVVECHTQAMKMAESICDKYYESQCSSLLTQIQAAIVARDYNKASSMFSLLPSNSKCLTESKAVLQSMQAKITEEDKAEFEKMYKLNEQASKTETDRLKAVAVIAKAYYKEQSNKIDYAVYIVR